MKSRDVEDVNNTIECLRNISRQTPGASDAPEAAPHHAVITYLIKILAVRVKQEASAQDALKDIDEIIVLCRELLTSDTPRGHLTGAFEALTQAVLDNFFYRKESQRLDQAIRCLKDALIACPTSFYHPSLELANLLVVRFLALQVDEDYQEAKAVLYKITQPPTPRAPSDSHPIQVSALSAALGLARSIVYSYLEDDWEGKVSRCRSFLEHCALFGDPLHPVITELLSNHAEGSSKHFGPSARRPMNVFDPGS
jgi:hypothetical protein